MHEYAIAQALADQVSKIARERDARAVTRVVIQVGKLRGVIPEILQWGFEVVSADSVAAGAELVIEAVAIAVRCQTCGAHSELDAPLYLCPICASTDVVQIAGDELILKSLEIGDERDSSSAEHPASE